MRRIIMVIAGIMIALLGPVWLYASGNLPFFFPHNERIIKTITRSNPGLAASTFDKSHLVFERLRDFGIEIPATYNERMLGIKKLREEVKIICNYILSGAETDKVDYIQEERPIRSQRRLLGGE